MSTIISLIGKSMVSFLIKLIMSLSTEKFIAWLFFYVGEQIVKSTKTDQDDVFLAKIKEAYNGSTSSKSSTD